MANLEFYNLFETVVNHKNALIKLISRIDAMICDAVDSLKKTNCMDSISKKYNISLLMVGALNNYVDMQYICEKLLDEIHLKIVNLDRNCEADKDANITNPFRDILFKEGIGEPPELDAFAVPEMSEEITDTQTVVPEEEEIKDNKLKDVAQWIEEIDDNPEPVPEHSKYTALDKLSKMNVRDRQKEAEKKYETEIGSVGVMKPVTKSVKSTPQKKVKENVVFYNIIEDSLSCGQSCVFTYIVSPSEFYVITNLDLLESLEGSINDDLNEHYAFVVSPYKNKEEAVSIVGKFAFSFIRTKRRWYRVEVIDWFMMEPEKVFIQLIDSGEKLYSNFIYLKPMTEWYSKFPRMAIKCHLAGLISPNLEVSKWWSNESINYLIHLSEIEKMTKFKVIYAYKEGDSFSVDLVRNDEDEKSLGEILVDNDMACQIPIPIDNQLSIIKDENHDEDLEEFDNINEAIVGYDATDEARICPFNKKDGKCFKGPSCKLEHGFLAADGITTDKHLIMRSALTSILLPNPGETVDVVITGYINVCHFYIHIIRNKTKATYFNDEYDNLLQTMNMSKLVQTYVPFKILPAIGEILLVKYQGEWYRGKCIKHEPEVNNITIFLVDHGSKIIEKLANIRQIKEEFLHLPFQAVECILNNCCPRHDHDLEEVHNFYLRCLHLKNFKAKVIESGEPLEVTLFDSSHMDLGWVLKEQYYAEDRHIDVRPCPNTILNL